jgi:hypothetical protein
MRSHAAPARFGVLTIRNQLHSGLWPGHQGKRAPPQNGPGLFFPALPRLIALVGNEWAPGSLGKQPAAHFPSPCSAGYPGRSREWLRPRLFDGSPRQFSGACRNHHTLFPVVGAQQPPPARRVAPESPGSGPGLFRLSASAALSPLIGGGYQIDRFRYLLRQTVQQAPPQSAMVSVFEMSRVLFGDSNSTAFRPRAPKHLRRPPGNGDFTSGDINNGSSQHCAVFVLSRVG